MKTNRSNKPLARLKHAIAALQNPKMQKDNEAWNRVYRRITRVTSK